MAFKPTNFSLPQIGALLSRGLLSLSVRARIVLLAVTPLVGFGIIGASFISGEQAVEEAFESTKTSGTIADGVARFLIAGAR